MVFVSASSLAPAAACIASGRAAIEHLLRGSHSKIAALLSDPAKARALSAQGVDARQGDYLDISSMTRAFAGIDVLVPGSVTAFVDALYAHNTVVQAAKAAQVKHIYNTAIQHPHHSRLRISQGSDCDISTILALGQSGAPYSYPQHDVFRCAAADDGRARSR
jgi:NAD(P)H dehydrogenase (quinone)